MSLSRAFSSLNSARTRARVRRTGVAALSTALTLGALALVTAAPAQATFGVSSFVCASDTVYSVDGSSHVISKVTPSPAAAVSNGTITADIGQAVNALALPNGGGRYIYAFNRAENKVLRFDATT